VSASAEQGIALFTQWLGLNLNPKLNLTNKENGPQRDSQQAQTRTETTSSSSRSARNMADIQNDKNDERFKQLLSAQDNILKGSATIGQSNGMETTFVYSKPSDLMMTERNATEEAKRKLEAEVAAPQHRVVVPKESRRGGRAYNIHQHVNEI